MSLSRVQYDAVMRIYDKRQIRNNRIMQERKKEAYTKIPELAAIDRETADKAVERLRRSLFGEPAAASGLQAVSGQPADGAAESLSALSPEARKMKLLAEHGFPEDYLDPVCSCKDCHDTGFVGNKQCHCFRQAVISLFYTQSGLQDVLKKENFDNFSLGYYPDDMISQGSGLSSRQIMEENLSVCREFASGFDHLVRPYLLLFGESGLGKTFLSHCIAKELIESAHSVIYFSAKDLFDRLGDLRFRSGRSLDGRADPDFDPDILQSSDLLIIDDLGTEMPNDFTKSEFFNILNTRVISGKGIIISTNKDLMDISDTYSPRIMSRISENFRLLHFYGRDIRILKSLG